jgi:hypothetical protein
MELSEKTLDVLKNFAAINPNLVIKPGNVLKTVAEAKNVMAAATVDVEFPQQVGIYDLNEFLSVLNLVDGPRLKFEDNYVFIGDSTGRSRVKYFFSDPEMLTTTEKNIEMPEADVKFTLSNSVVSKLKKAASVLSHSEICVSVVDGVLNIAVSDAKNSTSNVFSIDVDGDYKSDNFKVYILTDNLKLIPGDYEVELSSRNISRFKKVEDSVEYFIALEKHSTFGG